MKVKVLFYSSPLNCAFLSLLREILSFVLSFFTDLGMTVSSGLVASVQSLVAILQQQIDTNSHQTPAGSQNATTLQNLLTDNVMHFDSLASLLLFGA